MLWLVIKKEVIHNVLSFRFVVTYALLFCLILLAMLLMTSDYRDRFQEFNAAVNKERSRLDELKKIDDPSELFNEFQRASFTGLREPRNLSILARGLEGELPNQVPATGFMRFLSSEDRLGKNMLFEIFQTPDFAYVINIVMSLLALLFVFDAVCGEKEQGTLKLLMANSVPRDIVLIGKWIGGFISIAAPFSVAVFGGFAFIYITGAMNTGEEGLTRFGLIFLLALIYISTFFTLGLMISTLAHRTSTALLISLLVWICWILVVPNMAPVVARLVAPVPGRQVIDAEKQAIDREAQLLMEGIRKRKVYGDQKEMEQIQQSAEKRKNKLEEFFQDKMQTQVTMSKNLARLSPSASFLFAATRLAGTGPVLSQQFQKARERFQEQHQSLRNDLFRTLYQSGRAEFNNGRMTVKDSDWFQPDDLPRFRMFTEDVTTSFNEGLFDVLLLIVFNVLFFMLAFLFFLSYDVT